MLKKFTATIIALTMLFLNIYANADEGYSSPIMKFYLDGEEIASSQQLSKIPYATVVRKLGYTVAYDEDTQTIVAKKENNTVTIKIGSKVASIKKADENFPIYLNYEPIEIEGTTYIAYYDLKPLYNILTFSKYLYDQNINIVNLYTPEIYANQIKEKSKTFFDFINTQKIPSNFSDTSKMSAEFRANSNLFGIHVNGKSDVSLAVQKQDKAINVALEMKNEGLFNFTDLFINPASITRLDFFKNKMDLNKPIKANCYVDPDVIYIDSEAATPLIIYSDYDYKPTEKLEKAMQATNSGKIKIGISDDEYVKEAMEPYFEFLTELENNKFDIDEYSQSLATTFITINGYDGYDAVMKSINLLIKMISEPYFSVKETDTEKTATFYISAKDLKELVKALGFAEEDLQILNYFNYDIDVTSVRYENADSSSKGYYKIGLSNIPNPYGLEIGSVELTLNFEDELKAGNQTIQKPIDGDYLNYNEIDKIMSEK